MAAIASTQGDVEGAMNQALKLFILHFVVLYACQVVMQVLVLAIDYGESRHFYNLGIHAEDFLAATDVFLVSLFTVEIGVKLVSVGKEAYFHDWWHRADVAALCISWVFVFFGIARVCGYTEWLISDRYDQEVELVRDIIRLLRLGLFVQQLSHLLNSPLDHLAMMAEDLDEEAKEAGEII